MYRLEGRGKVSKTVENRILLPSVSTQTKTFVAYCRFEDL